jgi:hypothetical protein
MPDWDLAGIPALRELPAVSWKLKNITELIRRSPEKYLEQVKLLEFALMQRYNLHNHVQFPSQVRMRRMLFYGWYISGTVVNRFVKIGEIDRRFRKESNPDSEIVTVPLPVSLK